MTHWMLQARCATLTPQQQRWFISDREDDLAAAATTCRSCPVQAECYAYAAAFEGKRTATDRHGIYGGLTPAERAKAARTQTSAPTTTLMKESA